MTNSTTHHNTEKKQDEKPQRVRRTSRRSSTSKKRARPTPSSQASSHTVILKAFVRHYRSLLTQMAVFAVDTLLKQKLGESNVSPRQLVQVQTYKPYRNHSGTVTLPTRITISFSVTLKAPTAGQWRPTAVVSATPICGTIISPA